MSQANSYFWKISSIWGSSICRIAGAHLFKCYFTRQFISALTLIGKKVTIHFYGRKYLICKLLLVMYIHFIHQTLKNKTRDNSAAKVSTFSYALEFCARRSGIHTNRHLLPYFKPKCEDKTEAIFLK